MVVCRWFLAECGRGGAGAHPRRQIRRDELDGGRLPTRSAAGCIPQQIIRLPGPDSVIVVVVVVVERAQVVEETVAAAQPSKSQGVDAVQRLRCVSDLQ